MDRILLRYTENTEAYESRNNDDVARVRIVSIHALSFITLDVSKRWQRWRFRLR